MPKLSDRERQIMEMATAGLTDQAIANNLGIRVATVGTYWGRIRIKMGPLNRAELVAQWVRAQHQHSLIRLREENAELQRRVRTMEASGFLSALQGVMDASDDGILVLDAQGIIMLANFRAGEMFRGELVGLHVAELVPPELRVLHQAHREAYMADPERRPMGEHLELEAMRRDGTRFAFSATLNVSDSPIGEIVTCVLHEGAPIGTEPAERNHATARR